MFASGWHWLVGRWRWITYLVLLVLLATITTLAIFEQKIWIWYATYALLVWLIWHERTIEAAREAEAAAGDTGGPRRRTCFAALFLGVGIIATAVGLANVQVAFFLGIASIVIAGGMLYSEFRRWPTPSQRTQPPAGRTPSQIGPVLMLVALAGLVAAIAVHPIGWFAVLVVAAAVVGELGTERASEESHLLASTPGHPPHARRSLSGALVGATGLLLLLVGFALIVAVGASPVATLIVLAVLAAFVLMATMDSDSVLVVTLIALVLAIAIQPPTEPQDAAHAAVGAQPYFVVIGDSYISGEGADQFIEGTNTKTANRDHTNGCRQSNTAWPFELARRADRPIVVPPRLLFLACSGAVSENISTQPRRAPGGPQEGPAELALYERERKQLDKPAFVILSIGGNDAGFGDLGQSCIGPGNCTEVGEQFLRDADRADVDHSPDPAVAPGLGRAEPVSSIDDDLDAAYNRVRAAVGDGVPVVIAPYVQPFADRAHCSGVLFSRDERQFLTGFVGELNHVIANAAERHGFLYMDTMPMALRDRHVALCEGSGTTAGLNVLAPNPQGGTVADRLSPANWTHNSIHPNSVGHQALADAAERWFREHRELNAPAPDPTVARSSVRPLDEIMGGRVVVQCGDGIECRVTGRHWLFAQVHDLYAHAIAPLAIATVGLWLLILSAAWITRRRNWGVGHLLRMLWNRTAALRSAETLHRLAALVVLLAITVIALVLLGQVMGFPAGYNLAQKADATTLAGKTSGQVIALLDGTTTDLAFSIPAYLVVAFLVVMATSRVDPKVRWKDKQLFVGGVWSDGTALVVAAALGFADVVETLFFRWTLEDLQQGLAGQDLGWMTDIAATAFWIKWAIAALLLVVIIVRVIRPPGPGVPDEPPPADEALVAAPV